MSKPNMSKQSAVLRRLITVSAVVLGAGLAVTACSPVQAGSAAIVGNQRITIATLDTEVNNLSQAVERYKSTVQLSQAQQTQQTLSWLVRFKVNEELARQAGITVSTAQADKALATIYTAAKASAEQQGIPNPSLDLILAANGIPPNLASEVGRYQAIDDQFARQANGGKDPVSASEQTAVSAKLTKARCQAAKALNIQVNPQFGQLDYNQLAVVAAPGTVFRPAGPAKAASQAGLTPAC
jgi:peptidyl-prolyl cis-trans isomerase SurA